MHSKKSLSACKTRKMVHVQEKELSRRLTSIRIQMNNPVILGRGNMTDRSITRASRRHAELKLNSDGTLVLTALHARPCYIMKQGWLPLKIVKLNEEINLTVGDIISILPDIAWFRIVRQPLDNEHEEEYEEVAATAAVINLTDSNKALPSITPKNSAMSVAPSSSIIKTPSPNAATATLGAKIPLTEASFAPKQADERPYTPTRDNGFQVTDYMVRSNQKQIPEPVSLNLETRKCLTSEGAIFSVQEGNEEERLPSITIIDKKVDANAKVNHNMISEHQMGPKFDKHNSSASGHRNPDNALESTVPNVLTEIPLRGTVIQNNPSIALTSNNESAVTGKNIISSKAGMDGVNSVNSNDLQKKASNEKKKTEKKKKQIFGEEPVEPTIEQPSTSTSCVSQENANGAARIGRIARIARIRRPVCQNADRCRSENVDHKLQFSHLGDFDYVPRKDQSQNRNDSQHVESPGERRNFHLPLFSQLKEEESLEQELEEARNKVNFYQERVSNLNHRLRVLRQFIHDEYDEYLPDLPVIVHSNVLGN